MSIKTLNEALLISICGGAEVPQPLNANEHANLVTAAQLDNNILELGGGIIAAAIPRRNRCRCNRRCQALFQAAAFLTISFTGLGYLLYTVEHNK